MEHIIVADGIGKQIVKEILTPDLGYQ